MSSGASTGDTGSHGRRSTWIGLAIASFAFALYLPSLRNGFVNWDDFDYITANPHLGRLDWAYVQWSFTTWWHLNWHPLTWISYGIDHAVWGLNPLGFHLGNVLLHAANTFLVFSLALRLLARGTGSAGATLAGASITAALFGVHPLHVESVAWVSERKDVLYAAFSLLALLAYLRYVTAEAPTRARAYAATLALFVLSALAKPMAVTFPAVLLILDAWPLRRLGEAADRLRVAVLEKLPFVAVSLGVTWLTVAAQKAGGAIKTDMLSLAERSFVAVKALGFYLAKLAAPVTLAPLYPLEIPITPLRWDYLLALLAVAAITTAAWIWRKRAPVLAAGWAFYVVTLLPVIGLVQVGAHAAADRYMYLPILGPLAVVGAATARAWDAWPARRSAVAVLAALVVLVLGARTVVQIGVWRDSATLWQHVLDAYPSSVTAHYNLGYDRLERGDYPNAELWFQRTVELQPRHVTSLNELGGLARRRSSPREALQHFRLAIEVSPTFAAPHFNIAQVYEQLGERESARRHYETFVELDPPQFAPQVAEVRRKLTSW